MRTICYRAISMCRGERWVYGDLRHYNRNPHTEKWTLHAPDTGIETDIDETTIGQYTGLHDTDGREIYEGDIINTSFSDGSQGLSLIGWNDKTGCFGCMDKYAYMSIAEGYDFAEFKGYVLVAFLERAESISVVGNVHDNPELLT